jgi:alkylation response protein AidB-like acyl-CoA dehydrogenase
MKLSSDQVELKNLLRRFFQEQVTSIYLRERIAKGTRRDEVLHEKLQGLGILDGFKEEPPLFSVTELGVLAHECGHALVPEPVIEQVIAEAIVPRLLSSEQRSALRTLSEKGSASTIAYPACCSVTLDPTTPTASGTVAWTLGVEGAGVLIGWGNTGDGLRAFACALHHPSVTHSATTSLDLTTSLTKIELLKTPTLIFDSQSTRVIEDTIEAAKACEAAGICERVVEMTVDYVKTRQQFGVAIGSFQAIQHKLADCYARSEALTALSSFAAWSAVNSPDQQKLTARAAVLEAARTAPFVCETAIQAHGGIGFTWEYDLHLYLRRAKLIQSAFSISETRAAELISAVA